MENGVDDTYLWGERLVGVEVIWVRDCSVVDLVDNVSQERNGGWGINARWWLPTRPLHEGTGGRDMQG